MIAPELQAAYEHADVAESILIQAPVADVLSVVQDLSTMPQWSPECVKVLRFRGGVARTGEHFVGINRLRWHVWPVTGRVLISGHNGYAFHISALGMPVADWGYIAESVDENTTRLTEFWTDRRRGPVMGFISWAAAGTVERTEHNRAGMQATLAAMKAAVETQTSGASQ